MSAQPRASRQPGTPRGRVAGGRRGRWTPAVVALLLLAAACSSLVPELETIGPQVPTDTPSPTRPATESPALARGQVLAVGTADSVDVLDPALVTDGVTADLLVNVAEGLVRIPPGGGQPVPTLATSWEVGGGGATWTFTLRPAVTFHDGSPLDCADVAFSLGRVLALNHPDGGAPVLDPIAAVRCPDELTAVIALDRADATLLARLATPTAVIVPSDSPVYEAPPSRLVAVEPEELRTEAESYMTREAIIGTGPYAMTSYQPGESILLEAYDGYWGDAPAIPTVRLRLLGSPGALASALEAEDVDLATAPFDPATIERFAAAEALTVHTFDGGLLRVLLLDPRQPPFDDVAVRRAAAASIDRARIVAEVFDGAGVPRPTIVPATFAVAATSDPGATSLDGYELPLPVELWYAHDGPGEDAALATTVARSLNESGLFRVSTHATDQDVYLEGLSQRRYPASLLALHGLYPDPLAWLDPLLSSTGAASLYRSSEMDALLVTARRESDPAVREQAIAAAQQLAATEWPVVPLHASGHTVVHHPRVRGVAGAWTPAERTLFWALEL